VKRVACAVGVRTEECYPSMRYMFTLLKKGKVQPAVTDESDENDDDDRMDDMVADIDRGYDLESTDPPLEVQNF
jgi:hypothetical protein